jgi:hypothetical protein
VLAEAELEGIQISDEPDELRFDGDPMQFRFGVEARRIDIAFTYEPPRSRCLISSRRCRTNWRRCTAVSCASRSCGSFSLTIPVLGKRVMVGLHMKALVLRRAADRLLVVIPANLRPRWIGELSERFQIDLVQPCANHFAASLTGNPWDQHDHIVVSR